MEKIIVCMIETFLLQISVEGKHEDSDKCFNLVFMYNFESSGAGEYMVNAFCFCPVLCSLHYGHKGLCFVLKLDLKACR